MGDARADSDQVRENCAGPELLCVLVSRFLKIPIQNEFIGKRCVAPVRLGRAPDPTGVGGYMRKQNFWVQLKACSSGAFLGPSA